MNSTFRLLTSLRAALGAALLSAVFAQSATGAALSYVDLVHRLTDLERLATLPLPGETGAQFSSYDRKSSFDKASGKYVGWDANGDNDGCVRKEGKQIVMAEINGPGCLWRIWSAAPKSGHVRIYLDGATEPAVDLPFVGYFDGKNAPFNRAALVHTVAMGWNNYTPIPFQKSCKVVADPDWGQYYQFVYSTFAPGTEVPTFRRELTAAENAALDAANQRLAHCGPADVPDVRTVTDGLLGPGGTDKHRLDGAGAIARIRAKLDLPPAPADREALRELVLEIRWDGESQPSVWVPLGDFFGTAPGANVYRSLPCGLTEDGWFYANWFMPYGKSAEVTLRNEGKTPRKVKLELSTVPLKADAAKLARFHAKWHRDAFLPAEPERRIDWTMLKTEGRGRFVGVMLHIWNPRGGWWGEGDEKFFVDGEKFPSTIGTGSEDYFGYAWCSPKLFQNAFHNQTHNGGNNRGHVSVNRWHITDDVPFQSALEAAIEKYYPNTRPTLYAGTVFWYLAPGGSDPYRPVPLAERVGYWDDAQLAARQVKGAVEGERLKILSKTGGQTETQDLTGYGESWSGDTHLWWTRAKPGDRLELALPVAKAGRYRVTAQLTKARDYGIVQLWLDGAKLGQPLDGYNDGVVPTGALDFGVCELTAGEHKLTLEITGANAKAVKSFMAGLDYVKFDLQAEGR